MEIKRDGLGIVAAKFPAGVPQVLTLASRIATQNFSADLSEFGRAPKANRAELKRRKAASIAWIRRNSSMRLLRGRFRLGKPDRRWIVNYPNAEFGRCLCTKLDGCDAIGCTIKFEFDRSES